MKTNLSGVTIIAEGGVNHNGSINNAYALVDAAHYAGADYIKFQSFSADRLVKENAESAEYQIEACRISNQRILLSKLELSIESHIKLFDYATNKGIRFLSTGFDIFSISELVKIGVSIIKIPSGEITNKPLLRYAGSLGKEVFLSTGMSTLDEVEAALAVLMDSGTGVEKITVLHCTSEYPAPISSINLLAMKTIEKNLGVRVGYSDHSLGIEVAISAVALGAKVIEKHITLSRNMEGPDHQSSIEPDEFKLMVDSIRNIERALGDGVKSPTNQEIKNRIAARKSIVAKRGIAIGEEFTADNMDIMRPGDGISPMLWDEVLGQKAKKNYEKYDFIEA